MLVEISTSAILAAWVLVDAGMIMFAHRLRSELRLGFVALLAIVFGLYLQVRHGLILDYGSLEEIHLSQAMLMHKLGIVLMALGGIAVLWTGLHFSLWIAGRLLKRF